MAIILYVGIFILGLIIGSFLNCVIFRMEAEENFLKGRSKCPDCKHELSWKDLIPIISFLSLGGKCRYCEKQISWQYPLVEISTALIFLLIFNFVSGILPPAGWQFALFIIPYFLMLIFFWTIFSFLIIIFVYDLRYYLIPDKVIYSAIAISFLYILLNVFDHIDRGLDFWEPLLNSLVGALIGLLPFLLIFLISRGKWIGFGDVKLGLLMGLFLGWPNIILALFLSVFLGAIMGIGLMLLGKKKFSSEIPFGPFLITGTFMSLFWGNQIINWYLNLII